MNYSENLKAIVNNKVSKNSKFDCVVLFSGGKDSTYLAHVMKEYTNGRVCLLNVDNGYEDSSYAKEVADKIGLPLYTYKPVKSEMNMFYQFLLSTPNLKQIDENPLCFICNRYFTSIGLEFASKYDIPFVVSALTLSQIFGEKVDATEKLLNIANWVMKQKLNVSYNLIKNTNKYEQNEILKQFIDKVFRDYSNVQILYPFLYLGYNIPQIIESLEKAYDWVNPLEDISNKNYITSGCALTKLFGLCQSKLGFHIHELDELSLDYSNGAIDSEKYEAGVNFVKEHLSDDINGERKKLIDDLELGHIFYT